MRLFEALRLLKQNSGRHTAPFRGFLVCQSMPLHLKTSLEAHLHLALPQRRIEVETRIYGDVHSDLNRLKHRPADCTAFAIEWADLAGSAISKAMFIDRCQPLYHLYHRVQEEING
jgi:hypothetical protein